MRITHKESHQGKPCNTKTAGVVINKINVAENTHSYTFTHNPLYTHTQTHTHNVMGIVTEIFNNFNCLYL